MMEKRKFYGLKNDYMFHAVLQKNEEVLRNLLATLLDMDEADIVDCYLENPIELGKEIEGKECILDVKLTLNNAKIINIEWRQYWGGTVCVLPTAPLPRASLKRARTSPAGCCPFSRR